jgi:hypothetical protein
MFNVKQERAVLDRIAAREEVSPDCVSIGRKGAVFYRRGDELLCFCQQGSQYWYEIEAEVIAAQAIENASR